MDPKKPKKNQNRKKRNMLTFSNTTQLPYGDDYDEGENNGGEGPAEDPLPYQQHLHPQQTQPLDGKGRVHAAATINYHYHQQQQVLEGTATFHHQQQQQYQQNEVIFPSHSGVVYCQHHHPHNHLVYTYIYEYICTYYNICL